jgi:hypothetical protein
MLWESEGFALADSYDSDTRRYVGLVAGNGQLPIQVTELTLIVRPDVSGGAARPGSQRGQRARVGDGDLRTRSGLQVGRQGRRNRGFTGPT